MATRIAFVAYLSSLTGMRRKPLSELTRIYEAIVRGSLCNGVIGLCSSAAVVASIVFGSAWFPF
jgi:hypothetical protein